MPRNIEFSFRRSLEANFSDEVNLVFLTLTHPDLDPPIRVVSDNRNYLRGSDLFIGFPFDIQLLSDDEKPPTAKLAIQNVDPRLGEAIRSMVAPMRLKIELMHSDDFNISVSPALVIGSPIAEIGYSVDHLFLTNISVNAMTVEADIKGWDYLQRVWPGRRATQDIFPGLFK